MRVLEERSVTTNWNSGDVGVTQRANCKRLQFSPTWEKLQPGGDCGFISPN